jgi:FkbM family methyltransferase
MYSSKLPSFMRKPEWQIGFRYPAPIGAVRLLLRDNAGSDVFIHSEIFEHEYYRLPLPSPPVTILDLGANIGLAAVYFSRLFPASQLACVEPVSVNLEMLSRNLELNTARATVIPAAIDVDDGQVMIELRDRDHEHRIATGVVKPPQSTLQVCSISVPTLLRNLAWERIGLLKVDIEGHERVLFSQNCEWVDRVDAMCIECHDGFDEADLHHLAMRHGFSRPRRLPGTWFMSRNDPADDTAWSFSGRAQ